MTIDFLNLEKREQQTIRPAGYKFPVGLSRVPIDGNYDFLEEPNTSISTTNATVNAYYDGNPSTVPTRVAYSWTTTGEFENLTDSTLKGDLLIVAGGGAGSTSSAAGGGMSGGGAGGLLYYSDTNGITGPPGPASANSKSPNGSAVDFPPSVKFTVTVGGGGTSGASIDGTDSSVSNTSPYVPAPFQLNLSATGGGSQPMHSAGGPGGSGSGVYAQSTAGTGIPGQGNPGGIASGGYEYSGGGGGGAGGPGSSVLDLNAKSGKDGNPAPTTNPTLPGGENNEKRYASGGDGLDFDISGTQRTYAAGGGGSGRGYGWFGGSDNLGGRGSGNSQSANSPWNSGTNFGGNGVINRGSGGGGGENGGNGGGGIVIMQFRKNDYNYTID